MRTECFLRGEKLPVLTAGLQFCIQTVHHLIDVSPQLLPVSTDNDDFLNGIESPIVKEVILGIATSVEVGITLRRDDAACLHHTTNGQRV